MDVAIVGGGLVGMATAVQMLRHGLSVAVFEQEAELGRHQSGHNSNVIHSGAFYVPGSLKAHLSVEGRLLLEDFIAANRLPLSRPGKLVVQQAGEAQRFDELVRRAGANGVAHEVLPGTAPIAERDPQVRGERALWLPDVAVTDFRVVLEALADEVRSLGGAVSTMARARFSGGKLMAGDRYVDARHVVVAAGTGFNRLCPHREWRIVGFRGSYRELEEPEVGPLVYGVPDPRYPFLGVHLTPTLEGRVLVGPNATMAPPIVAGRAAVLAWANRRMAMREVRTWLRPSAMQAEVRRYVPDARVGHHVVESGVRAQAVDRKGRYADDFVLLEDDPGVTWVANAPSPAATACLAIGRYLTERVLARLGT